MLEYIEREALRAEAIRLTGGNEFAFDNCFPYWQFSKSIKEAPAADVAPVVHGKWMQCKTQLGKIYSVCSNCKTDFKFKTDKGTFARLDMNGMPYCPNCGCRMDKEDET